MFLLKSCEDEHQLENVAAAQLMTLHSLPEERYSNNLGARDLPSWGSHRGADTSLVPSHYRGI